MCKQLFRQLPRILKAWRPGFSVLHLLTVIKISHRASSKVAPGVQAASFWLIAGVFRRSQTRSTRAGTPQLVAMTFSDCMRVRAKTEPAAVSAVRCSPLDSVTLTCAVPVCGEH